MPIDTAPGALWLGGGRTRFRVWAPSVRQLAVRVVSPEARHHALSPVGGGYHEATLAGILPGARYFYDLDGRADRPDPASRLQPEGVHGPSEVVDPAFAWSDSGWRGIPWADVVLYELHVGTFTPAGTFDAAIEQLDRLRELGVTAVELMPLAQFPGTRNWGYDGVYPWAVQHSYGGPAGLKRFVDAAHRRGIAVVLDVVYNHLGPEGNYLSQFGPYFTDHYRTPWGTALNFDGRDSDAVRDYFVGNALRWIEEFHIDGLRLDAVHAIYDFSARPFLSELSAEVDALAARLGRPVHLIAESDMNDPRMVRPRERGGHGLTAAWNDEFHHALRVLLTGERAGYYRDFGTVADLAKAFTDRFVFTGEYAARFGRRHGVSAADVPADRFLAYTQNHDQVGNRMLGERPNTLVHPEARKLAAAAVLLSPFTPMLFMGEEYGEPAPFLYFVSHGDPQLVHAVREGRRREFAAFAWAGEPPDPQDPETFRRSVIDPSLRHHDGHRELHAFYAHLLRLRRRLPRFTPDPGGTLTAHAREAERLLLVIREEGSRRAALLLHFGSEPADVALPLPAGQWQKALDSADGAWGGPGGKLPELLSSGGEATLTFPAWSASVFVSGG
jgi:maltooligosyltrehalose trehalohydrolase